MDTIKKVFSEFQRSGFFSRVDATHILDLYIGLDDQGRKAIELRASFTPVKVTGTSMADVPVTLTGVNEARSSIAFRP